MKSPRLRHLNQRVGIIAVDPSSPFSGGALLGDRIRMRDLYGDSGILFAAWPHVAVWAAWRGQPVPLLK